LQNVGQFLEKLDGEAGRAVEERAFNDDDEDDNDPLQDGEDRAIANILAARGLSGDIGPHEDDGDVDFDVDDAEYQVTGEEGDKSTDNKEIENYQDPMEEGPEDSDPAQSTVKADGEETALMDYKAAVEQEPEQESISVTTEVVKDIDPLIESASETDISITKEAPVASEPRTDDDSVASEMAKDVVMNDTEEKEELATFFSPAQPAPPAHEDQEPPATPFYTPTRIPEPKTEVKAPVTVSVPQPALVPSNNSQGSEKTKESSANAYAVRQAQKEARTLRRHVVTLNKQLETAEAEMQAQRTELERAAERMEKDRTRHKEEREKEKARQAEESKVTKAQHEQALKDMRMRTDQQIEEVKRQLRDIEDQRTQEGGDWNKELADAITREQETAAKFALMDDEKATCLSQIATLQAQQEALGNRLESLTHTADNAMERERDAEDRLDEALSLHARQISQRQARETELERTVSELGDALVASRNKQTAGASAVSQSAGDDTGQNVSLVGKVQTLEQEVENLHTQLSHEKQRNDTLKHELKDVSREYTEEATVIHSRQQQHDRHDAELSQTISRLKAELRESRTTTRKDSASSDLGNDENDDLRQIKSLSEEVLRQREKVSSSSSEVSALKSRLKVALGRAVQAEAAAEATSKNGDFVDVERAPISGNGTTRRRGGSHKSSNTADGGSMRAALHLDTLGTGSQRVGKSLDALDKFLVESGKCLRYNPLARILFIVYLLMLHLWTFLLLFVHAHTFENVHGDFGAGGMQAHGPHALMQEHPVMAQAEVQAQASTTP
jgi:hypothetical protein